MGTGGGEPETTGSPGETLGFVIYRGEGIECIAWPSQVETCE